MIWLLLYAYYDDWEILGAYSTHEKAKQATRDYVRDHPTYRYDTISIIEMKLDELREEN